jgi:hypothetical protein
MDLHKGEISKDCTISELSTRQLLTPNFFNIRIFEKDDWIGNIYMLDFVTEYGVLLVDRIQIPRDFNADIIGFFPVLKEALKELFQDCGAKAILLPQRISNHGSIQSGFNKYKDTLQRYDGFIKSGYSGYFESLRQKRKYYVLS